MGAPKIYTCSSISLGAITKPTRKIKREDPSSLDDDTTSHWLHGNSIPKIGCHYFWPGGITLAHLLGIHIWSWATRLIKN
jgi:hypothetical protein